MANDNDPRFERRVQPPQSDAIVKVGQIWRDNDPRINRFVRVVRTPRLGFSQVRIRRCYNTGENKPGCAEVGTDVSRFSKKGTRGFTLVKDVP